MQESEHAADSNNSLSNKMDLEQEKVDVLYDTIYGKILKGQYKIDHFINSG